MNIDQFTALESLLSDSPAVPKTRDIDTTLIGKKVIIRTYSAGVWFGVLEQKNGAEVILANARRMYRWQCAESITLSSVATKGIDQTRSKIVGAVPAVWLEAIEIIPIVGAAAMSIETAPDVPAD